MKRTQLWFGALALVALGFWIAGCTSTSDEPIGQTPVVDDHGDHADDDHGDDDHAGHDHGDADHADDDHAGHDHGDADHDHGDVDPAEIEKNLALLSPEDRALADKQKVCLVSDEPLGAMGKPIKLDVNGQAIFICCAGCKDPILSDPDKYLAKLNHGDE